MNLPYVKENISDYQDSNSILHWSNYGYQVRKASTEETTRITITRDLYREDEDGNDLYDFYYYEFENGKPVLMTQYGNGYEFDVYYVDFSQTEKYKKAIAYFEQMERVMAIKDRQYKSKK